MIYGWTFEQWCIASEWCSLFTPLPSPTMYGMADVIQTWNERRKDQPGASIALDHLAPWKRPLLYSQKSREWVKVAWKSTIRDLRVAA